MSSPTARAGQASTPATGSSGRDFDWRAIEGSPEFRQLVQSKRRFIVPAAAAVFTIFLAYLLLATFAEGFMGSEIVDGPPVAWALAVSQVVMTWVVTWLYLRKADREWEPLERRAAERAAATVEAAQSPTGDRFVR